MCIRDRHHLALLVDEDGGFSGIVTIENLVEEIMGDINEEYEEVVPEIECVSCLLYTSRLYDQSHYKRTDSGSNRMLWKSGCQSGRSRI